MVKALGNNGVVIVQGECGEGVTNVEGECGKRVLNHGGGKVAKEKLQTWHCLPTKCDNKHARLHLRCIKKIGKMH
jgi:hypothetical protein